nr:phospholipase D-like domain-containing protein [Mesorhizobium sp.]
MTPGLARAFDRALARGVRIDVVGRIDLKGDIGGRFLTALNKLFVEKYGDRIDIREFKAPDVVLHSKIMMIDQRLVTISSVNLNKPQLLSRPRERHGRARPGVLPPHEADL